MSPAPLLTIATGALGVAVVLLYRKVTQQAGYLCEVAAKQQILEFAALYTRGIDRLDPELVRQPFTEDGVMDIPNLAKAVSVKEFSVGATDFLGKTLVASMHNISNAHIVFSPDFATAQSSIYFIANHFKIIDGKVVNAHVYGRYCDTWVNCDGTFKIKYRKLLYDFQGDDWNKAIEEANKDDVDLKQRPSVARHENLGVRDKSDYDYSRIDFYANALKC